jgi:hypothetical protein
MYVTVAPHVEIARGFNLGASSSQKEYGMDEKYADEARWSRLATLFIRGKTPLVKGGRQFSGRAISRTEVGRKGIKFVLFKINFEVKPTRASDLRAVANPCPMEIRVPVDMGKCGVGIGRSNLFGARDKVDSIVREVVISGCDFVDGALAAVINESNLGVASDFSGQSIVPCAERHCGWT